MALRPLQLQPPDSFSSHKSEGVGRCHCSAWFVCFGEHYIDLVLYLSSSKDSCDHLENHSFETPQNKYAFKLDYRTREANGFRNPHRLGICQHGETK